MTDEKRAVIRVWLALSAITVVAWQLAPGHSSRSTPAGDELVAGIVVLALVKCRLIVRTFMEVRTAPRWVKAVTDGWLVLLWVTLLGVYRYGGSLYGAA